MGKGYNIMNGSVTIVVTELGDVKLLDDKEFKETINNNEHNTWIATVGEEMQSDIEIGCTKF